MTYSALQAKDYPFQLEGAINTVHHEVNEILRVEDFSASLDGNAATLSAGQTATFHVTVGSINHFANEINFSCQPSDSRVTCTVSPAQVNLTDGAHATAKLTIKASGTAAGLSSPSRRGRSLLACAFLFLEMTKNPGTDGTYPIFSPVLATIVRIPTGRSEAQSLWRNWSRPSCAR